MRRTALGLLWMLTATRVVAHPFHESQTEIDYRAACRCLEITLRVRPEEMEAALLERAASKLPLEDPRMQQLLEDYVVRHFMVSDAAQHTVALSWVGSEIDSLGAWIYLQSAVVQLPLQLRNGVLLDYEPQQVNHVLFRADGHKQGLSFSRDTPQIQWLHAGDVAATDPKE
jgi:hypothetical protein